MHFYLCPLPFTSWVSIAQKSLDPLFLYLSSWVFIHFDEILPSQLFFKFNSSSSQPLLRRMLHTLALSWFYLFSFHSLRDHIFLYVLFSLICFPRHKHKLEFPTDKHSSSSPKYCDHSITMTENTPKHGGRISFLSSLLRVGKKWNCPQEQRLISHHGQPLVLTNYMSKVPARDVDFTFLSFVTKNNGSNFPVDS